MQLMDSFHKQLISATTKPHHNFEEIYADYVGMYICKPQGKLLTIYICTVKTSFYRSQSFLKGHYTQKYASEFYYVNC